ncbi:efflux RND transporter periplasmic adaptor subunit [Maribacter cobaltidurans]|uniref:efflux RND transporter periplasmic adaptor subunit n=1 Tax=Maribacter cobaltidurans TaxID=1178778 RepID=UPI0029372962|nr:efflux RND transporter periplasmic adaptor subunit [Maribacter cobaltidurans]
MRYRRGALVSPNNAQPLTIVADISKVYAYFSMNEKDYLDFIQDTKGNTIDEKIQNLPEVELILANGRVYDQKGKIETINSQVDAATGAITFRAKFDNPSRILTNGNSAKIRIPKKYENVLVVPKESTFDRQGSVYVYQVLSDSTAVSKSIAVINEVHNLYLVESGIQEGDKIVGLGVDKLRGDTKIIPKSVAFDSVAKPIKKLFR